MPGKRELLARIFLASACLLWFGYARAAENAADVGTALPQSDPNSRGGVIYSTVCATCHDHGVNHAPAYTTLRVMTSAGIYKVLTVGPMQALTTGVSDSDKKAVAEYLAGPMSENANLRLPPKCAGTLKDFNFSERPAYAGNGGAVTNDRYVAPSISGIDSSNVAALKLKWAFSAPGATRMRSNPAVGGGSI